MEKAEEMRQNLRWAVFKGVVSTADRLDQHGDSVADIMGCDSLEYVELIMALEPRGTKTVGELMNFMDGTS